MLDELITRAHRARRDQRRLRRPRARRRHPHRDRVRAERCVIRRSPRPHRRAASRLLRSATCRSNRAKPILDYRQSYVTHGELNADRSNAILVCASLTGTHHRLDFLIGPGKALDPARWFIVATDPIGNGLSTSPSNSRGAAGHALSALRAARHGQCAASAADRASRHRPRACGRRRVDGRHAGAAMGGEPSTIHARKSWP